MADQIFPGFHLGSVDGGTTEEEVGQSMMKYFGPDTTYRSGFPDVTIIRHPHFRPLNVIVEGTMLPWKEIKRLLAWKTLNNQPFQIMGKDFGLPRAVTGLMRFQDKIHCQHLCESYGEVPPYNPFFHNVTHNQLGGVKEPSNVIYFNKDVQQDKRSMVHLPGNLIRACRIGQRDAIAQKINPGGFITRMEYEFTLEAVQAIFFLNRNPKFSDEEGQFFTEKLSQVMAHEYIGRDGKELTVGDFMRRFKYVPLEQLDIRKFDLWRIQTFFQTDCWTCHTPFTVLGLDGDLRYLAVICGRCTPTEKTYAWPEEPFFRMTLNPRLRKLVVQYDRRAISNGDPMVRLLDGLKALYEDVPHFRRTAGNAAQLEFQYVKREMALHHQRLGVLSKIDFVERITKGKQIRRMLRAELVVQKSGFWNVDVLFGISKCNLILNNDLVLNMEKKQRLAINEQLKGKLYDVREGEPGEIILVVVVSLSMSDKINEGDSYWLIPKPPSTEKAALGRAISKWRKFDEWRQRLGPHPIMVSVKEAGKMSTHEWNNQYGSAIMWNLGFEVPLEEYWTNVMASLEDDYIAADVSIDSEEPGNDWYGVESTLRILSIKLLEENQVYEVDAIIPLTPEQKLLKNDTCYMRMWRLMDVNIQKAPKITDPMEMEVDVSDAEDSGDELESDTEDDAIVGNNDEGSAQFSELEDRYKGRYGLNLDITLNETIVNNWQYRPNQPDFSMLDFFLHPNHRKIDHSFAVVGNVPNEPSSLRAFAADRVESTMNPSQMAAIRRMMNARLSVTHGPPGTGKTQTCVNGVAYLQAKEKGKVFMFAPSNFAVNVMYDAIMKLNERLRFGMRIVLMMSSKRESSDLKNSPREDPNLLHRAVRLHPMWKSNNDLMPVLEKDESLLTEDERLRKKAHIRKIEQEVLMSADVIICTVGAGGDSRLKSLRKLMKKENVPLAAIVLDEVSLLTVPGMIQLLTLETKRVWLLGDDQQLPPVVSSEGGKFACLDVSWTNFLRQTPYVRKNGAAVSGMLNVQYRMASSIANLVSQYCYEGQVASSAEVMRRNYLQNPMYRELRRIFPEMKHLNYAIYSYEAKMFETKVGDSKLNEMEAFITLKIVKKLVQAKIHPENVQILSMYDAHLRRVRQLLDEANLHAFSVNTVDSFQGKEKPIIIINLVRSNEKNTIGFLRQKNRINVAISRAIDYLFIVGNTHCLTSCGIPDMLRFFEIMRRAGVIETQVR